MLLCYCGTAFGWGKSGHDAIAYIAECNLTPKARKNIEKYLDGRSIVYYASWMDVYRHTPAYKVTSGWHGDTVDADGKYVPNAKGDAVQCIEEAIARLKDTAAWTIRRCWCRSNTSCTWWATCIAPCT